MGSQALDIAGRAGRRADPIITVPTQAPLVLPEKQTQIQQTVSGQDINRFLPAIRQFESTSGRAVRPEALEGLSIGAFSAGADQAARNKQLAIQERAQQLREAGMVADDAFRRAQQGIDVQNTNEQFIVQREAIAAGVAAQSAREKAAGGAALGSVAGAGIGFVAGGPMGALIGSQIGGVVGGGLGGK